MENYTEEQVQKMSLSEVVCLLNEQQSQIDMYREASEYRGQQLKTINEKINIINRSAVPVCLHGRRTGVVG